MKALITLSYLVEADPDEVYGIGSALDEQAREAITGRISELGLTAEDFDGLFAYFGVSVTVQQELESA